MNFKKKPWEAGFPSAHGLSSLRCLADLHELFPGRLGKKEAAKEGKYKKAEKPESHQEPHICKKVIHT